VLDHLEIESKDRVLEIGCGNRLGSIVFSKITKEVMGIDISLLIIVFIEG
jgi:protein-L-isoaspartate O-methyltransferase